MAERRNLALTLNDSFVRVDTFYRVLAQHGLG